MIGLRCGICIYTHTHIYYSPIKRDVILPLTVATWIDLENIIPSEVRQKKLNVIYQLYVNLKIIQMNLYTNEKQTHRYRKQANVTIKGGGKGIS